VTAGLRRFQPSLANDATLWSRAISRCSTSPRRSTSSRGGAEPGRAALREILAAGCLNHEENGRPAQRIFGSYTVGDNWTFVRADLDALDTAHPSMLVVSSWEINEKQEAATIVKILKAIVAQHGTTRSMPA
jgi:hypothetical protein